MDPTFLSSNATTPGVHQGPNIPTAAILCLALGTYLILLLAALLIRRYLKTHEWGGASCCTKDKKCSGCRCPDCRACWGRFESAIKSSCFCESCQMLKCKQRCCACHCCCPSCDERCWPCCSGDPMCECGRCNCTCTCNLPKCHSINCCCFKINIAN